MGDKVYILAKEKTNLQNHFECDVSKAEQVEQILQQIGDKEGVIDTVVNCAGFGISGAVELTQNEQAQSIMDVNFMGTFYVCKYALKYMKKGARIVNISSACALYPVPFRTFYCASKAAVQMLSYGLSMELKDAGIQVCAICPGEVKTNFTKNRVKNFETNERYGEKIAIAANNIDKNDGKRMSPSVVANAVIKQLNRKKMKPCVIVSKKYNFLNVVTRFVTTSTLLKFIDKLLGGKKPKK